MKVIDFIKKHKNKIWVLFLYAFFGVIGTVLNIVIFYLLSQKCNINYLIANFIAWIFSIIFAFVTNKIWVFKSTDWQFRIFFREFATFVLARIATCVFDMGYMYISVSILKWDETISKVIANFVVIVLNYVLSKLWIFKNKDNESEEIE